MKRERSIVFSTDDVRAIREGRKTQFDAGAWVWVVDFCIVEQ